MRRRIENVDHLELAALADLPVVEIVRRRDLDRARALLGVGVLVADDRNLAADQRQHAHLADQVLELRVLGMDRDAGIAEHGLRPRRADHDADHFVDGSSFSG